MDHNTVDPENLVLGFDQIKPKHSQLVGYKATNLSELRASGIPVPDGFVITVEVFDEHLEANGMNEIINDLLVKLSKEDEPGVLSTSNKIQGLIRKFDIPKNLKDVVSEHYLKLSGFGESQVALKLSPVLLGSKGKDLSFHQHKHFLNVRGVKNLLENLKEAWAELYDFQALMSYLESGAKLTRLNSAVVVQEMIQAEASGMLFNNDPVTDNSAKQVVEAIFGLGETLLAEDIVPDTYIINKKTNKIEKKHLSKQEWMLVRRGRVRDKNPNIRVKVSESWQGRQKLGDKWIAALGKIGKQVEKSIKGKHDIEWAYGGRKLWVIQSFPVTKLEIKDTNASLQKKLDEIVKVEQENIKAGSKSRKVKLDLPVIEDYQKHRTATKILLTISDPTLAPNYSTVDSDGVGLLKSEYMLIEQEYHPEKILSHAKRKREYVKAFTQGILDVCESFGPDRPVVYRFTDLMTYEHSALLGGDSIEDDEWNHMLGHHGASRYAENPDLLRIQIAAIKGVRNKFRKKNLWIHLPFVRSAKELIEAKKVITSSGLRRSSTFKLFAGVSTPLALMNIEKFVDVGVDGLIINLDDIAQLMMGVDRENSKVNELYSPTDPAFTMYLEEALAKLKAYDVVTYISGEIVSDYEEIRSILIDKGVTGIIVRPELVLNIRKEVASLERNILINSK